VAKACAFVNKRDFVTPEDVKASAGDVFAHRLILSAKARLNEYSAQMLVAEILASTKMPALTEKNL
jgi:MoxR-like ATPase